MSITLSGPDIQIRAPLSLKARIKALPGARWSPRLRCWTIAATRTAAHEVCREFGRELQVEPEVRALAELPPAQYRDDPIPVQKTEAWRHQRAAFWFCVGMFGDDR